MYQLLAKNILIKAFHVCVLLFLHLLYLIMVAVIIFSAYRCWFECHSWRPFSSSFQCSSFAVSPTTPSVFSGNIVIQCCK